MSDNALKRISDTDYELKEDQNSVWITVDNISVYIRRTDEGVSVGLYPKGREMDDEICGTWCLFTEAEEPECSGCGRTESQCSSHPCRDVIADRKA